ncbi:hypothetical protein VI817_010528 [Penicillium citrinum]|nr:hypothetical protein VI817_010528 [Penicillium citrinum]
MHREHIRSNPAEDPPRFIGYLDYEELRDLRERKTSFKRRRPSLEGSYFARRCSRWTTNTWTRDPYLLFMLLAIAEARCHLKQDNSSCKSITSRLLLHNWEQDANHIYLYEASFDISLINAIMQQGKTITEIPQITILWKRISLRPYDTFPRRLQQWILDGNLASQETSRNLQSLGKDMTQESHMSHCLAQKKKREKRDADKTKSLSGRRRKFTSKSGHQHQISDRLKSDM